MDLAKLNQSVQSQIRSDMIIYNLSRCVTELVENAIDAEATCVAVKMNLTKFQIQVVDNGSGVKKEHLDFIGTRYWSTKFCSTNDQKIYSKPHDNRGEFLASIKNLCSRLMIVSRAVGDEITYCKVFDESKTGTVIEALHQRVSKGTTVIINNFFGNLPVRQKRIVPAVEIQNTKRCIQAISLMYPSILFILKDDAKNVEILRIPRTSSTLRTFRFLFPPVIDHHSSMIKVVVDDRNIAMRAMICRKAHINRDLQFVFVNKRFIIKSEIRSLLNELLSKKGFFEGVSKNTDDVSQPRLQQQRQKSTLSKVQPKHAIFILNICCRPDEYRVTFLPDRRQVDFRDRMKIKHCLIKLVDSFWERGLFGDSSVPQNNAVISPEKKTKSTFMPRLLFEKIHQIRTLRGAPAYRKVAAAKIMSNEEEADSPDIVEMSNATDEAPGLVAFEGLLGTTSANPLALEMPHRNHAPSSIILEPFKQFDSRPVILEKLGHTERCPEKKKPVKTNATSIHQPAQDSTPCTPLCSRPLEIPILSTVGSLNRQSVLQEKDIVAEKLTSGILNTSKICKKLLSISTKVREINPSEYNSKSSFTLRGTYNEECIPSCCIQTNSNIRLYDVKRKFHLRRKKTTNRACKLKGLRKVKLKEMKRQLVVDFPKRKKSTSKKMAVLKKSVLKIDDNLYESKIQPSPFSFNPKLSNQSRTYSQKILFNLWSQSKSCSDLSARDTLLGPVKQTQISKTSLTCGTDKDGAVIENQERNRTKSMQSLIPKQNLEIVSRINRNKIEKPVPNAADFIYAPSLKLTKNSGITKSTFETLHSKFSMLSQGISPEIFTSKKEISQNRWCTASKMIPYSENGVSRQLFTGTNCSSEVHSNLYPALKQQEKPTVEKSCKVPHCICSCHKTMKSTENSLTRPATLVFGNARDESENRHDSCAHAPQISPTLFSKNSTEAKISDEAFTNHSSSMIALSKKSNTVYGSNIAKTHSLGIFSELAELYSTKRTEASRYRSTSIGHPLKQSIISTQNEAEVLSIFSKSHDQKLSNEAAHDSYSLLTQSMDRCSIKNNTAEVSSNRLNTFCSNIGKDFRFPFIFKRISSGCGEKISDVVPPCGAGPNDPTLLANELFSMDEDNFSIDNTPGHYDFTQMTDDDSFSVNLEDYSNDTPRAYSLSQLASDSFSVNLENFCVGNTPGVRYSTRVTKDSFSADAEKSELGKLNVVGAHDFSQPADNSSTIELKNSKLSSSDAAGIDDPIQFTSDSLFMNLENSKIRNVGTNDATQLAINSINLENSKSATSDAIDPTQLAYDSSSADLKYNKVCNVFGTNDLTQLTNDWIDLEDSKVDNTVGTNDPTQLANDSSGMDPKSCPTTNPTPIANTTETDQSDTNERFCHENDLLIEKTLYRRNSKFLGAASVFDIPKGILDVQSTKSIPIPFEKSQKIDFNKFTKPCSMKNHLTIDDYGNSCLRIFPLMKEIIDSKEDDYKLDYNNFPEELNCSIIFSKVDLKSIQFITQLDKKFLLTSLIMEDTQDQIIVMFDQHAVDERIRVERLSKEYVNENGIWRSVSVNDSICIRASRCEISIILEFREDFCNKGIDFDFTELEENSDDQFSIKVIRVPLCLHNRARRESTKTNIVTCLKQLTESLIKELTHTLIRTRGISRNATPQTLQNIINFEACRGAVKFGEQLSSDICSTLLQSLWSCNMPFQCAHGRPLLAPLANVAKLAHIGKQKLLKRTFDEMKIQLL